MTSAQAALDDAPWGALFVLVLGDEIATVVVILARLILVGGSVSLAAKAAGAAAAAASETEAWP